MEYRHAAGVDMLVQKDKPPGRRCVRMVFEGAEIQRGRTLQGIPVAAVDDLARMKLTRFRIEDAMCLNDIDRQKLPTPEMEAALSPLLAERLKEARARA